MGGVTLNKRKEEDKRLEVTVEEFNLLENWNSPWRGPFQDLTRDKYREKILSIQEEQDMRTNQLLLEQHPEMRVQSAVPVENPPVQQHSTQESFKARRKRQQKEAEVDILCPHSDTKEETYDLSHSIKDDLQARLNACNDNNVAERCRNAGSFYNESDYDTISAFCQGYRTNRFGHAANLQESRKKQADKAFIDAYFNYRRKPEQMVPFLDAIVNDLFQADISKDMFSDENFRRRGPEIRKLSDKLNGLKKLMVKFPDYFNRLPEFKRNLLQQMTFLIPEFDQALKSSMRKRMVSFSDGEYDSRKISGSDALDIEMDLDFFENPAEVFRGAKELAINGEVERKYQKDRPDILEKFDVRDEVEENSGPGQKYERYAGINFTGAASLEDYMNIADARDLITSHPEEYEENKLLIDEAYTQIYKAQDLAAESDIRLKVFQKGLSDVKNGVRDALDMEVSKAYDERVKQSTTENSLLHERVESLFGILRYLLKETELSNDTAPILRQLCETVGVDFYLIQNRIQRGGNR